jgi:peptidyl-dipeptidase Dcp
MNSYWENLPEDLKSNPFFHFSAETNYVPAWDKIRTEYARPALEYALKKFETKILEVAGNPAKPTFKNTVEPFEEAFALTRYLFCTLYALSPENKEDENARNVLEQDMTRLWYDTFSRIFSNQTLFKRLIALGEAGYNQKWSMEKQMVGGMYFNGFVENGIRLNPEAMKAYHKNQKKISELGIKIHQRIRDAAQNTMLFISDPARMAGIPQDLIDQAAKEAEKRGRPGEWAFLANRVIFETLMQTAENRQFRKDMWTLFHKKRMVGPYKTSAMILEFAKLSHDGARLKSGTTPAAEILHYNMARRPAVVSEFLLDVRNTALPVAKKELKAMAEFAEAIFGIKKLEPWDLDFLKEKMKKIILSFDEQSLRPYFELENVLDKGIFPHIEKQLGLYFTRTDHYPNYHEDTRIYDVKTKSGRHAGVMVLDLYDRPGKMSGYAWSMNIFAQGKFEGKVRRPVNQINMKLTKPVDGKPTLLTHDEVTTLMHEFGHGLHDLKSECQFTGRSGTTVDIDLVEFPSQLQEFIAFMPDFLRGFARHYETDDPLPEDILQKIEQSRKFMKGRDVLERSMRGWLDFQWHNKNPDGYTSVKAFEEKNLKSFRLHGLEYPLYSPAFDYTFGGGYDSSFYSYQWAQVMSDDLLSAFNKRGLYDRTLKAKFAKALANGGTVDGRENYLQITGRDAINHSFFKAMGLMGKTFDYSTAVHKSPNQAANDSFVSIQPPEPKAA